MVESRSALRTAEDEEEEGVVRCHMPLIERTPLQLISTPTLFHLPHNGVCLLHPLAGLIHPE